MKTLIATANEGDLINGQKGMTLIAGNGEAYDLLDSTMAAMAESGDDQSVFIDVNSGAIAGATIEGFDALQKNETLLEQALIFAQRSGSVLVDVKKQDGKIVANTLVTHEYQGLTELTADVVNKIKLMLESVAVSNGTIFYKDNGDLPSLHHYQLFWNWMITVNKLANNNIIVATDEIDCVRAFQAAVTGRNMKDSLLVTLNSNNPSNCKIMAKAEEDYHVATALLSTRLA